MAYDHKSGMDRKNIVAFSAGILLILCAAFSGCTGVNDSGDDGTAAETPSPASTPASTVTPEDITKSAGEVVDANSIFAFDLYQKLAGVSSQDENIFFSPYSISSAFALVYEGAKGDTAAEINSVFHFPAEIQDLRDGFLEINSGINAGDPEYELSVANALWAEKTYSFLDDYIKTAKDYYSADTTNLDFINQPEESRLAINKWAEDETHEKIKDLIPQGMIDPMTRLVITNAVYFKGDWVKQFDVNNTHEAAFTTASGKSVTVDMMQRTDEDAVFGYMENDDLQMLKMPYDHESGRELAMYVILPKGDDLRTFEEGLDSDRLTDLKAAIAEKEVKVFFPKFKLETEYSLSDTLADMGMPVAFSDKADFSGMDGTKSLSISDVIHKAYVDVNEEGTEAAAATAVVMRLTAVMDEEPVPVFMADHPFIFMIEDTDDGNILFMGKLSSPA
ncbi:serpin family protein [Methanoplanus limicola]|uniref:Proteinase inhibitor I4 serpin n=1 Tax=Methanoplanus limicola DSM 2279 TaxID=937775 RepID=H1Z2V9_9EURY|nr:serpin family protein [Methanoplanus limicola]EHQ34698.1 proteinase inhibitor I4 serpin [Methanoplanus limicola DSM 2279]